ncbi:MAG: thiamine phosphate synthase [Rhodospirillaceae bacterium]|nr:thiamine phosphate synthase [Rhodospirillaceae bacterium]HAA93547.1 thiamine phosphate synthase [Rhodospirillaceae bacterium]
MEDESCRLYLITPPQFDAAEFSEEFKMALDGGDVACLQIRLKDVDDDSIRRATETLLPIAQSHDVAVLMNDRPDLAAELGCDGVHVGQEDTPYAEARALVGDDAIVGVTCKRSRHLAIEAADQGADYVAFGGFFHSTTKVSEKTERANPEILTWWAETTNVPCVAIGGITVENCGSLVEAGANMLCVIAGVWSYPAGPAAAVKDLNVAMRG